MAATKVANAMLVLLWLLRGAHAMQYTVGGPQGWATGTDMETWAAQYTFYVGDELFFSYPAGESIVLLVGEEDYKKCSTDEPVASDGGKGDMVMSLMGEETYYFISGNVDQCSKEGLHLKVPVVATAPPPPFLPPPPPKSEIVPSNPAVILTPPHSPPYITPYGTFHAYNSTSPMSSLSLLFVAIIATMQLLITYHNL